MDIIVIILFFIITWVFIMINFIVTDKEIGQLRKMVWSVEDELTHIKVAVRAVEGKEEDILLDIRDITYRLDKSIAMLRRIQDRECSEKQGDGKRA